MSMKAKQWRDAHILAAELVIVHRTDANQLKKTAQQIAQQGREFNSLRRWLRAHVTHAADYPRSQQTKAHMQMVERLVLFIGKHHTQQAEEIALMVAWIANLMAYYKEYRDEAKQLVDEPILK